VADQLATSLSKTTGNSCDASPIRVSGLTMGGVVQSSWLDLSLLIEGQLLSQKQDFRAEGCARAEQETEEKKPVRDQIGDQDKQRIQ